jgi:hypothetical protein
VEIRPRRVGGHGVSHAAAAAPVAATRRPRGGPAGPASQLYAPATTARAPPGHLGPLEKAQQRSRQPEPFGGPAGRRAGPQSAEAPRLRTGRARRCGMGGSRGPGEAGALGSCTTPNGPKRWQALFVLCVIGVARSVSLHHQTDNLAPKDLCLVGSCRSTPPRDARLGALGFINMKSHNLQPTIDQTKLLDLSLG